MRVVLRNMKTGLFFRNSADWSENAEEARDFMDATTALYFAKEQELLDVEILLKFQNPKYDIVVLTNSHAGD